MKKPNKFFSADDYIESEMGKKNKRKKKSIPPLEKREEIFGLTSTVFKVDLDFTSNEPLSLEEQ
jgi:hypothetical protein